VSILITNDDGPNTAGLIALQEAVKATWPEAFTVTLTTKVPKTGAGMAITTNYPLEELSLEQVGKNEWTLDGYPADLIYYAFLHADHWLTGGATWRWVVSGINYGQNVGMDVYHSGTVACALLAAKAFGAGAYAFGQKMEQTVPGDPKKEATQFARASKLAAYILRAGTGKTGEMWNVNFPDQKQESLGFKYVPVAHYSRWYTPPTDIVPRARAEDTDIVWLNKGFVTVSELDLRVNPALRL